MDSISLRSLTIGIIVGCLSSAPSSAAGSQTIESRTAGPGILAVLEQIGTSEDNRCPVALTVRRFVLGNPTTYLGERLLVCVDQDTPVFTLKFGSRSRTALGWADVAPGDLIRFWPEDVMRPTDPISMRADSVELVEKSGGHVNPSP